MNCCQGCRAAVIELIGGVTVPINFTTFQMRSNKNGVRERRPTSTIDPFLSASPSALIVQNENNSNEDRKQERPLSHVRAATHYGRQFH